MKTRKIIDNQDLDERFEELKVEFYSHGNELTCRIVLDLEVQLRDALCDLERARRQGFRG